MLRPRNSKFLPKTYFYVLFSQVYVKNGKRALPSKIQDGRFTLHGMLPLQCMKTCLFNIVWHAAYQIEALEELNSSINLELTLVQSNVRK